MIKIGIRLHWSNSRHQFLNFKTSFLHLRDKTPNSTCKPLKGTSMNLGFTSLTVQTSMMGQTTQEFRFQKAPKNATTTFKWWVTQRSFRMTFWIESLWKGSKFSQRGQRKSVNGPWMHLNSPFGSPWCVFDGDDSISERFATWRKMWNCWVGEKLLALLFQETCLGIPQGTF